MSERLTEDRTRLLAAELARADKLVNSICACTNLTPEEVYEITDGAFLDVVLKAAALTGECMKHEKAARTVLLHALDLFPQRNPKMFVSLTSS
ncbi:hypothetical protein LCGC14_0717930 [marine sediment metagenome]|uniref:Uncharacterized protein n=1 Tax=marine sediment metagenome TaxID=412755 RepID=A0A0F9QHK5_9ZZZZ